MTTTTHREAIKSRTISRPFSSHSRPQVVNYSPKEPTRTLKRNQIRSVRLVWQLPRDFIPNAKKRNIFGKKFYYQTTRSALHRIIRIELNGEVFFLFACLCRRRCVEYSFNQRYALGILDILQALFSIPDCSKEGRSGSIF